MQTWLQPGNTLQPCFPRSRSAMSGVFDVRRRDVGLYAAVVVLWCMLAPLGASAEQFTGKVVKVRLYGIDTPEKAQAFGTQARQFTSDAAFQQTVTVVVQTTDRYGRLVGEVLLPDGRSLNQELVKAGMAWWYRPYA